MHPAELEEKLETLTVVVDTREQDTPKLRMRLEQIGLPYAREKLNYGDYSAKLQLNPHINSDETYLDTEFVIERKMSLDELAQCFTRDRARFKREFERAEDACAKTYLVVENGSWDKILAGQYRSKMTPKAFIASLTTWLARYDCQIIFCSSENSGRLIGEIIRREAKEYLEGFVE